MDNMNYWPYTNIHELNLDWIISKVKELDTRFTSDIETFVREYIDEHFAEWTVNANYNPDDETIIYTNGTGATLTAGDVIRFAIDNAFVNVKDPTARTAASNAAMAAAAAQGTADNAATAASAAQSTADSATSAAATVASNLQAEVQRLDNVNTNQSNLISSISDKLDISKIQLYSIRSNSASFTFPNLPEINAGSIRYALLWGGSASTSTFLFILFINTDNSVTQVDVKSQPSRTFTYTITDSNLVITTSDIMYGGLRLLWLN